MDGLEGKDSRERLMEATRQCLLERGHAGCSVKAIAEMAGVNHGLVHHHFGSKEGLIVSVILREATRRGERLLATGSPEGARAMILENLLADRTFFHLVIEFFALARRMPKVGEAVRTALRSQRDVIGEALGISGRLERQRVMATLLGLALMHSLDPEAPAREVAEWLFNQCAG